MKWLNKKILTGACAVFGLVMLVFSQPAAALTVDTKIGEALLGNSGDATEAQALADILGIDVNTLSLVEKNNAPAAVLDGGNWVIDVNPDQPSYFLLKFGIGGLSVTADTFFFANIAELTKLVFTDSQVQGITGATGCNNCNIGRLSHYTDFNATVVPLPAALPLFAGGLGLMGLFGWRRKRLAAA